MLRRCTKSLDTLIRRQGHARLRSSEASSRCQASLQRLLAADQTLITSRVASITNTQISGFHLSRPMFATDVKTPEFPDSVSEGDVKLGKNVGDSVGADEVVMEIETDKTAIPVMAPSSGVITKLHVNDGDTVKAGQLLFSMEVGAVGAAPPKKAEPEAAKPAAATAAAATVAAAAASVAAAPAPAPAAPIPEIHTPRPPPPPRAPSAPISSIPVAAIRHAQSIDTTVVKVPPVDYSKEISGTRSEQRVKMNRMRLRIAQRLKEAQNVNAMLTTFNEIDMSNIIAFRKKHLDAFTKKYGIKLGFMSPFVKAAASALQDQPVVNAVIDNNEIVYRDYVDISVAVATPKGLVVPILRNVQNMNYADIETTIASLGNKARDGKLTIEEMDGGTFTISNGGVFGSLMGTPIINPPQSAILGMHGTFERPVAINGQVVVRPMMYIALTYDHRLIDGREAVLFLKKIKLGVEDPSTIIAGL